MKTGDIIRIRQDALQDLINYGIDEPYSTHMLGKSFKLHVDKDGGYNIFSDGLILFIPDYVIETNEIDSAVVADFLSLLR